ncbi:MAG: glycoside hydrolase family protein [Candidatus Binataceae bacterium]|nr:glycoside hydrolase family protein [Candidatus Binataceae bacterium]
MPVPNNYITYSVGDPKKGAANRREEVSVVQGLLNVQIIQHNRSDRLLRITGSVDSDTLKAIIEFQRRLGIAQSGLIEPRDGTFRALLKFSGPRHMRASQGMIDQIKRTEKLVLHMYDNDGAGNTTIGYGHLVHPHEINADKREKEFKNGITEVRADDIFREDLGKAEKPIDDLVGVPLTQHQFDALVSLVFNIGSGNFKDSTLLKMLNGGSSQYTGDYLGAAGQFRVWREVRVNGSLRPSPGLINRRRDEETLFSQR